MLKAAIVLAVIGIGLGLAGASYLPNLFLWTSMACSIASYFTEGQKA